jgi:acyl-phosphate glycerol 3-phosphate acyltransferase
MTEALRTVAWILAGLALGCLPFSYWVGRLFLQKDIRHYGDGNPGATNVFHAGGPILYVFAGLLDAFKAALPVWLAQEVSHIGGFELALVAIAPLAGNIFTPFLRFHGGTGVAVVYGVWLALLGWTGPVVIAASFGLFFIFIRATPWCVIFGMLLCTVFLLAFYQPLYMSAVSMSQTALMAYQRRQNITDSPRMQNWVIAMRRRNRL